MADENTGTEVTTQRPKPDIVQFSEQLEARASQLKMALPSHISPEKFQRTIITTTMGDPELLKADRQSLVLACMKAAQDGLLPDKREAAIVVFKENKKQEDGSWKVRLLAQYLPMVYGLRKKILQSGEVVSLEVNVVYAAEVEAGKFLYEVGLEPPLRHRPMMELTAEQTTDEKIVAAYSIATMKDGKRSYEMMRRFEIDRVRETSKTGATKDRNGKPRQAFGPWVDWFPEMAKKTVMRRHAKTLPQSGDVIVDVEADEDDAANSAARVLASQEADAPRIEHREDDEGLPAHDPETGEISEGDGSQAEEPEKPKRTRRTRAQIEADEAAKEAAAKKLPEEAAAESVETNTHNEESAEGNASASQATSEAGDASNNSESSQTSSTSTTALTDASHSEQGVTADDEAAIEQEADNRHPAAQKAVEIIAVFEKQATVIDLKARYDEAELDIAAMPEDIAEGVAAVYLRCRRQLGAQ